MCDPAILSQPSARHGRYRMEGRFIRGDGIAWLLRHNLLALAMWRVVILLVLLLIAGCQHKRPDFMTRVMEDCGAGDQCA
jgi:hypothetical protein